MTDVKGKWALITGANRGIGYRIAKTMASYGCNLILHSRNTEHTKEVLKEVLDMGYHECNCIMHSLERRFPQKKFIGIPENIEFKEYDKKELEQVIKFIQKEIESREVDNE